MKRLIYFFLILIMMVSLCACSSEKTNSVEDGLYSVDVTLSGGTGKASITSAQVNVSGGEITAEITWSSSNYDYMIVNGEKVIPVSIDGGSKFEFTIPAFDEEVPVQADTVAMSTPHLIDYTLTFDSSTLKEIK